MLWTNEISRYLRLKCASIAYVVQPPGVMAVWGLNHSDAEQRSLEITAIICHSYDSTNFSPMFDMLTSWPGNVFRIIGPLSTGGFPLTTGQYNAAVMLSLLLASTSWWRKRWAANDLRRHDAQKPPEVGPRWRDMGYLLWVTLRWAQSTVVEGRYKAPLYNMILHTALQWPRQDILHR